MFIEIMFGLSYLLAPMVDVKTYNILSLFL